MADVGARSLALKLLGSEQRALVAHHGLLGVRRSAFPSSRLRARCVSSFEHVTAESTPKTPTHSCVFCWQVVEWDEVRFDVRLMQRVPYEGVSRMQTSLRRKHRDRVVRRSARALLNPLTLYAATRVAR